MSKKYVVGIDLGTSNSALSWGTLDSDTPLHILGVPQIGSWQAVEELDLLPSNIYLPLANEAENAGVRLPWEDASLEQGVIGQFAREKGAQAPDRLVSSAKSWLANPHVDPTQPILPWKSSLTERLVAPTDAARRYLNHLLKGLEYQLQQNNEWLRHEELQVVITVPASFDEVARIHTHDAAEAAGWQDVTLLEEQQAAFYHWIQQSDDSWREHVSPGDIILICDVGGGTADFSLVAVAEQNGQLALERVSVGDHILLGGDNMDLALAYNVKAQLDKACTKLDNWQFLSLIHSCRLGKEKLFAGPELDAFPISLAGRGSSLFGGTISTTLPRTLLQQVVLDGFFPVTGVGEQPQRRQAGLREMGLEYAADPVFSKHLAAFLVRSCQNIRSQSDLQQLAEGRIRSTNGVDFIAPTAVLFNGGVFKAGPIRQRVLELLQSWTPGEELQELTGINFDLAVAKGAAAYARILATGEGVRIKAGTARSYYIGLESSMPAVPGLAPPLKAICVVPQGMEEGSGLQLPEQEFGLVTGQPVEFRFFSSSVRAGDQVGDIIEAEEDLEETSCLELTLPEIEGRAGEMIPVRLESNITEVGTLELWMRHQDSNRAWKLEFNVRGQ